jgi:hypothetical protein
MNLMAHKLLCTTLFALLGPLVPSCTYASGKTDVLVCSTPAGASILIDGVDTGVTTPALIDIGKVATFAGYVGGDHQVTIRKSGFEPEIRRLYHHTTHYTSKWNDGATDFWMLTCPLFWTLGDFFTPFGVEWVYVPHEVHVKLYPAGEAPGQFP